MDINNKRPVVWQDVRRVKPVPIKPVKKPRLQKIKSIFHKITWIITNNRLIKIIVLKISKLKKRNKKILFTCLSMAIILSALFIIKFNYFDRNISPDQIKIEELAAKTPQFKTVIPKDKTIDDLGGWHKLTPPNSSVVFVYIDQIDNVKIRISQQTLPEDFKNDKITQIEELAKNFKADEKITVGDTVAYIGTSISGVQSVIFEKNDTLILITSAAKIDSKSWADYISKLQ